MCGRSKAQKDHWQPTRPFFIVLAVAGNSIFEHVIPAHHYTIGFGMIGLGGLTANFKIWHCSRQSSDVN